MSIEQKTSIDTTKWELPTFKEDVFFKKKHRYALVIPVINEGTRIQAQLKRTNNANLPVDVIVADGGSTDGSLEQDYLIQNNVRALLTKTGQGRLSAQLRMAYAWCLMQDYEGIVTIDGNGKDNVEATIHFLEKLDQDYDYVQGSRYRQGGKAENTPLERTIGNRFIHAPLMSISGRRWFTDTTNGYRAYSRRYLCDPRVAPFRSVFMNYELLFYLTVRAGQLGFKTCEIPVQRSYPKGQATPTKISNTRAKFSVLEQAVRVAIGKFTPRG